MSAALKDRLAGMNDDEYRWLRLFVNTHRGDTSRRNDLIRLKTPARTGLLCV